MAFLLLKLFTAPSSFHPHSQSLLPKLSPSKPYPPILLSIAANQQPGLSSIAAQSASSTAQAEESSASSPFSRRKLIAQNIPWTSTADEIKCLFGKHGAVVDVELLMYNKTKNRGLAFITMASEEEALAALNNLNSYDLGGRVIKVEFSRSLKKSSSLAEQNAGPHVNKQTVFVGNLSWRARPKDLREFFAENNYNLLSSEIIFHSNPPRRSAGYGFVSFASREEAEAAVVALNGKKLMGRNINLVLRDSESDDVEAGPYKQKQLDDASSEKNAILDLSN